MSEPKSSPKKLRASAEPFVPQHPPQSSSHIKLNKNAASFTPSTYNSYYSGGYSPYAMGYQPYVPPPMNNANIAKEDDKIKKDTIAADANTKVDDKKEEEKKISDVLVIKEDGVHVEKEVNKSVAPAETLRVETKKEEKPKDGIKDLKETQKAEEAKEEKKKDQPKKGKHTCYTKDYLLTFKETCKARPFHMKEVNIPLMKWKAPVNEDARVKTIKEVRNLLNKFAKANYKEYSKKIVGFEYTSEVLIEVAKILFNKAVKEANYVEYYMELCDQLMKKFREKELNFRKMFITKCQNIFEENKDTEYDQVLKDVDEEERRIKHRLRLFGNIKLIGELFIRGALNDTVLIQCFTKLFGDKTEEAVENLCHLANKVGKAVYYFFAYSQGQTSLKKRPKLKIKTLTKDSFDEYIDRLIDMKSNPGMTSRVKFMIQDIIEVRDTEWVKVFDEFVVKENDTNKIVFHAKEMPKKKEEHKEEKAPMVEDPKVVQRELRKSSLNETNILGIGLEAYASVKLDEATRLKANNLVDEYLTNGKIDEAEANLKEKTGGSKHVTHIWIGYFLIYADSKHKEEVSRIFGMLLALLKTTFSKEELLQGILVHLANYYDALIDYPLCEQYFYDLMDLLTKEKVYDESTIDQLKTHAKTLKKKLDEEYA